MTTNIYVCICLCLMLAVDESAAQQPDSVRTQPADSASALQSFMAEVGPAEAVFSFFSPPPYRFKSGVYGISDPDFPLLTSPDSLVQVPVAKAYRQRRKVKIAAIATAVPLLVFTYSVTRVIISLGTVVAGRRSSTDVPSLTVMRTAGIATLVGITVTSTFNIASLVNSYKGIRQHNRFFGRRMPTIFNPKGL